MNTELTLQQNQNILNASAFDHTLRVAKMLAASSLVPQQYQEKQKQTEAIANCVIAMNMAQRMRADPLMVMQNLYIVHGNPGWSSKFLIACVNTCGRFSSLRYEWRGTPGSQDYGCRAWAVELSTDERLDGVWVDWKMVNAEGWQAKNGSKWKTMADQMFVYRAAAFWTRAYAPEISMGLQTAEEIYDVGEVEGVEVQTPRRRASRHAELSIVPTVEQAPTEVEGKHESSAPDAEEPGTPPTPALEPVIDVDQSTGEVISAAPAVTKQSVLSGIAASKTVDDINECLDFSRGLPSVDRKDVEAAAKARINVINKAG